MKNNKSTILWIIVIIVIASISFLIFWYINRPQANVLQGQLVAQNYRVSSKLVGRVDSLTLRKGDRVQKGQFIYSLSVPEVQAKYSQAAAMLSAAKAKDQEANAGARPQEVEALKSIWEKSVAGLNYAESTFDRVNSLYNEGVVAAQKYDEALASLKASQATELAAKAQYEMAKAGARIEDKEAARALVAQAEGGLQEVKSYLNDAIQYSPVDGEVSSVIAEKGELVSAGFPVVTMVDLNDSWFAFNIKETMLPDFKIGSKYDIFVPAINETIPCKVTYIAVEGEYATWSATKASGGFDIKTFNVELRPINKTSNLRPGMSGLINM